MNETLRPSDGALLRLLMSRTVDSDAWVSALEDCRKGYHGPCVYFVQQQDTDLVKIGYSKLPGFTQRLGILQIGNPHILVARRLIVGDESVEAALHQRFYDCHWRGEWFRCNTELAEVSRLDLTYL